MVVVVVVAGRRGGSSKKKKKNVRGWEEEGREDRGSADWFSVEKLRGTGRAGRGRSV